MKISRRSWLRGALGAGLALPFLPSLMPRAAHAEGSPPKRLICLVTQQGQRTSGYVCTGGERSFTLSTVLEPLAPYRDRIIAMHNLRGFHGGHGNGSAAALTAGWDPGGSIYVGGTRVSTPPEYHEAYHFGPSIDQLVAQRFGGATALPSMQAGVMTYHAGFVSYAAPDLPIPPVQSPRSLFDRMAGIALGDPASAERLRAQGLTVVDAVAQDFAAVQRRLSASERRVVDAHLAMLESHGERLSRPAAAVTCDLPDAVGDPSTEAGFDVHTRLQMENIVTALKCDITRVVSMAWGKIESNYTFPWLGFSNSWHGIAHGEGSDFIGRHNSIKRWHMDEVAELCRRLDEVPDGDGTLLDNTLIFVADELQVVSESNMASSHGRTRMPALLIGDAQGFFDTGRYLDMGGRPYGDLLFTIGHAMGLTDLTTFGSRGGPAVSAPPPAQLLENLMV